MPPLPNVPKVIRLDVKFSLASGTPALSRQFYHYTGTTPTSSDMAVFVGNAGAGAAANLPAVMSSDYVITEIEGTDLSSAMGAQSLVAIGTSGSVGGPFIPEDACFVCAYTIPRRYRGGHPRGYFPFGVQSDLQDERSWQSGSVTNFVNAVVGYSSAVIAGGWTGAGTITQVSVSYFHGFTVVTSPTTGRARNVPTVRGAPVVDTVGAYVGRELIGSQRRRIGR